MSVPSRLLTLENIPRSILQSTSGIHYQTPVAKLIDQTVQMGEGTVSDTGALVIKTGKFTGRAPKDRFIVRDSITENAVDWNDINQPVDETHFFTMRKQVMDYLNSREQLWVRDAYACADPRYRMNLRVICEKPWTALFAHNMFLRPDEGELEAFKPEWTIYSAPGLLLDAQACGVKNQNAVMVSFEHKTVLIAGTGYTGETKKSIFSILNFILPQQKNVLSMHCSANVGAKGDTAVFFGLSGTGKTTLSADPERKLIGDDEHGWADDSVFNFEGGCYAKLLDLTEAEEPDIYHAVRKGALVENTVFYPGTNKINFEDDSITQNTRVSYPLHFIPNALHPAVGAAPKNIFFLTCDCFAVLPPISKLSPAQAMYQFISGYTAKIAGTEAGVLEPKPTFSACFGAPFMPLHPAKYAALLGKKMQEQKTNVWLINTGWTGGPYGEGKRMSLHHTRVMIRAALNGALNGVPMQPDAVFGFAVPESVPGVPAAILHPRDTWSDKTAFDKQAQRLAQLFVENFKKYEAGATPDILAAAPAVA